MSSIPLGVSIGIFYKFNISHLISVFAWSFSEKTLIDAIQMHGELLSFVFGPVPSRRLGKSLGINNIPPKTCSYSCVYCQLGRTTNLSIERRKFYDPDDIVESLRKKLENFRGKIDYVTFVPDGEPTLDKFIGFEAEAIKQVTDFPLAVLTNSSLLFMEDVRKDLMNFDLVSLKIDAVSERTWKKINRPHPSLSLEEILRGIELFSKNFEGKLITETMLVNGLNSDSSSIREVANFLSKVGPEKAYISVPTRPPAEKWVKPANEEKFVEAHESFEETLGKNKVELLTGYEGPEFHLGGDPAEALLAILAVHPMRIDYAHQAISRMNRSPGEIIAKLIEEEKLKIVKYHGKEFLVRKLAK